MKKNLFSKILQKSSIITSLIFLFFLSGCIKKTNKINKSNQITTILHTQNVWNTPNKISKRTPKYHQRAQGYGQISKITGRRRINYVSGYYRKNGTYVKPYYRS
ncbi:hypothetical protein GF385_01360 [Candidatus Dependentiae bacterium]|nr:hypothetical protein [Candidatus Dependentiae bacterium]